MFFGDAPQRAASRRRAWHSTCSDAIQWVALLLTFSSSGLALARSLMSDEEVDRKKTLFGFEFGILIVSYFLQYVININKIEDLRLLHRVNRRNPDNDYETSVPMYDEVGIRIWIDRNRERVRINNLGVSDLVGGVPVLVKKTPDGGNIEAKTPIKLGYIQTNGLEKGVSLPTNLGLVSGVVGSIASAIAFFYVFSTASEVLGVAVPILSNTISTFAKTRLEIEEKALEKVVTTTADAQAADRDAWGTALEIATCRCYHRP